MDRGLMAAGMFGRQAYMAAAEHWQYAECVRAGVQGYVSNPSR